MAERCRACASNNYGCALTRLRFASIGMFFDDPCAQFFDGSTIRCLRVFLQIRIDVFDDVLPFPLPPVDIREKQISPAELWIKVMGLLESCFSFFKERRF